MEQLKVRKKDTTIINSMIYLFLSFLFLYLQYAYRHQLSPFSVTYMRKSIELFWYAAIPILISFYLIWTHHKLSLWAYNVCVILVSYKVVEGLFLEFNKIIVIALFFYAVISYFISQLLSSYLSQARINPNYTSSDLFDPLLRKIPCELIWEDKSVKGFLTNWDEEGCFVCLDEMVEVGRTINLTIHFQGREFTQMGELVATSKVLKGVGIKLEHTQKDLNIFHWGEFVELIYELGFQPKRLR
jgi:hypothetical protein